MGLVIQIKDGNGEVLYPKSSFLLIVQVMSVKEMLFSSHRKFMQSTSLVLDMFDKVKRNGKLLGKRTIAGRIVKESYGAAKQQHTFTVEVLWSKGIKKLPPLFPLLVKGRNLYKLKTFRQRWKNEAERLQVLAEKHKRGAAARLVRSKKKAKKKLSSNGGEGYQKHFHHTKPAQVRRRTTSGKGKRASIKSRAPESSQWHQRLSYPSKVTASNIQLHTDPAHNFYHSPMEFHHGNTPYRFSSHDMCSTPNMMRLPPFRPYADTFVMPPSWHQGRKEERLSHWSTLGCYVLGSESCVVSPCWNSAAPSS
ncbi:Zinc finger CCCH domain-containing protein 62 [Vitis vinifera]|uniref:Zinc finger CCCH domain-containing protein 62 n=1 Tax=Vitis vinifera TaxID=29760 RepID=A0A438FB33_VITVI|nr:Zinc finger CCCH domain-containing protein 62 [Vitis vinifera]